MKGFKVKFGVRKKSDSWKSPWNVLLKKDKNPVITIQYDKGGTKFKVISVLASQSCKIICKEQYYNYDNGIKLSIKECKENIYTKWGTCRRSRVWVPDQRNTLVVKMIEMNVQSLKWPLQMVGHSDLLGWGV